MNNKQKSVRLILNRSSTKCSDMLYFLCCSLDWSAAHSVPTNPWSSFPADIAYQAYRRCIQTTANDEHHKTGQYCPNITCSEGLYFNYSHLRCVPQTAPEPETIEQSVQEHELATTSIITPRDNDHLNTATPPMMTTPTPSSSNTRRGTSRDQRGSKKERRTKSRRKKLRKKVKRKLMTMQTTGLAMYSAHGSLSQEIVQGLRDMDSAASATNQCLTSNIHLRHNLVISCTSISKATQYAIHLNNNVAFCNVDIT